MACFLLPFFVFHVSLLWSFLQLSSRSSWRGNSARTFYQLRGDKDAAGALFILQLLKLLQQLVYSLLCHMLCQLLWLLWHSSFFFLCFSSFSLLRWPTLLPYSCCHSVSRNLIFFTTGLNSSVMETASLSFSWVVELGGRSAEQGRVWAAPSAWLAGECKGSVFPDVCSMAHGDSMC